METIITSLRGNQIPEGLKQRAGSVVARLARRARRPTSAQVTFGIDHQRATVEIMLRAARGAVHVASAEAMDHRTALDRASAKLRRQLDKRSTPPKHRVRKAGLR